MTSEDDHDRMPIHMKELSFVCRVSGLLIPELSGSERIDHARFFLVTKRCISTTRFRLENLSSYDANNNLNNNKNDCRISFYSILRWHILKQQQQH
mmetsp:Transcript_53066/g.79284  ORF Transcript_53066/g.79284 Transcript_53066/m.79284 type:complete len:96 (-) Transcript_53066:368-655(-)